MIFLVVAKISKVMRVSDWLGIGSLVFVVILFLLALIAFIYAERENSKISSWPLYKGFSVLGDSSIKLSCSPGRKLVLQRAVYGPFGNCPSCQDIDATDSLKSQIDGKETTTIKGIPTNGVWGGKRSCPSGNCSSYALWGTYSCEL